MAPFAMRVETNDLVLTAVREGDIPELVDLALDGIHDPVHMPFLFPWTDAPAEELPANYVRYIGRVLAGQSAESTSLQLVVRCAGQVVGIQALDGPAPWCDAPGRVARGDSAEVENEAAKHAPRLTASLPFLR